MDEKIYTILLSDGTEIGNLRLNGNNYISESIIVKERFNGNCSPVIINDGEHEELHENMELVQITNVDNNYWFILRDISSEELANIKIQSDIEYIAMMTGVEL